MSGGKLPEGWVVTNLQNIANWGSGGTPSRSHDEYYNGNIPWIKTGDLGPKLITEASEYITDAGVKNSSAKYFPKGSVALAMYGATIGKTSILGIDATTNQACAVGSPIEGITSSIFLYYFLLNEKNAFIKKGKGGAQPNISQAVIKEHPLSLPPYAEQKIIAEKLDTLLAQVRSTKARLEQIPQILKRFRQAVLAAAVTGRLTKENNDYTKKTIELDNYKISIPKKWTETILNNVINTQRPLCYGVVQPGDDTNDGIELIRVCDINDGEVDLNHLRRVSKEIDIQYKRSKVQKNDILVTIVGAIGRIGIVREDINVNIARAVARVSPECKLIKPMFLHIWLSSPVMQTWLVQSSKEVARKTLNLKDLKEAFVPLPSIEEQAEIVRRVEQLFAYADTIEKQVNNALNRVNSLTQSILAKAFRGELTAQWRAENPSLISGENSAAALLERIKAERAASSGKKNWRKKA
ncbi:TPA: restriction endonuclease subunit S [Enterobacter kobei]